MKGLDLYAVNHTNCKFIKYKKFIAKKNKLFMDTLNAYIMYVYNVQYTLYIVHDVQ